MTPIYDNNGTTNLEIGKLYDNNGSSNFQITEVYDNNSTSNSLIYKDETEMPTLTCTAHNTASSDSWDLTNYSQVIVSFSAKGTWGYWGGGAGTASRRTLTIYLVFDGTAVRIASKNFGNASYNNNSSTLSFEDSVAVNLTSYTAAQLTKVQFRVNVSQSWSTATYSYSTTNGTATGVAS